MKYTIYQPKQPNFIVESDKKDYSKESYNKVYAGEITEDLSNDDILEKIFCIFNMHRPEDFKGHSLSVEDIVVLDEQAYICDICGWNKIELN